MTPPKITENADADKPDMNDSMTTAKSKAANATIKYSPSFRANAPKRPTTKLRMLGSTYGAKKPATRERTKISIKPNSYWHRFTS